MERVHFVMVGEIDLDVENIDFTSEDVCVKFENELKEKILANMQGMEAFSDDRMETARISKFDDDRYDLHGELKIFMKTIYD